MTTHDPILDHEKPTGCVPGALAGLGMLVACVAVCVAIVVGAGALAVHLWRFLT